MRSPPSGLLDGSRPCSFRPARRPGQECKQGVRIVGFDLTAPRDMLIRPYQKQLFARHLVRLTRRQIDGRERHAPLLGRAAQPFDIDRPVEAHQGIAGP